MLFSKILCFCLTLFLIYGVLATHQLPNELKNLQIKKTFQIISGRKLLILYINGLMIFTCIPYRHTSLWRTYVVVLICTVSGAVLQVRIQIESDAMTCLHTERFVDVPVDPRDMGPVQPLMLFVHRIVFQSDVNRGGGHTPTKKWVLQYATFFGRRVQFKDIEKKIKA